MDVFLVIQRKKTTIFLDAKENTSVEELKKMIEGITKVPSEDQVLYKDDEVMDPSKSLGDYDLNSTNSRPQSPGQVGLAFKDNETGEFEPLDITSYSTPPELPDIMITPEPQAQTQMRAEVSVV